MKKILLFCLLNFFALGVEKEFKIKIGASIPVEEYFLKKIGGEFIEVVTFVPQIRNPYLYEPSIEQVRMIKNLSLYVAIGIPFERKWIKRFANANPSLRILDLSLQDCKEKICFSWLSLSNAKKIANQIAYALRTIDIKNAKIYKENLERFLQELEELDGEIRKKLSNSHAKKEFGVFQNTWNEFALDFSLQALNISNAQDLKVFKEKHLGFVLITPFNLKKHVLQFLPHSKVKLEEINPFDLGWKENLLKATSIIAGE